MPTTWNFIENKKRKKFWKEKNALKTEYWNIVLKLSFYKSFMG